MIIKWRMLYSVKVLKYSSDNIWLLSIYIAIFCANRNMELCRSHQYYFDNFDNLDYI
jgi:hypothetical protein